MHNTPEQFQQQLDHLRECLEVMEPMRGVHSGVRLLEVALDQAQAALDRRPYEETWVLAACLVPKLVWDGLWADYVDACRELGLEP